MFSSPTSPRNKTIFSYLDAIKYEGVIISRKSKDVSCLYPTNGIPRFTLVTNSVICHEGGKRHRLWLHKHKIYVVTCHTYKPFVMATIKFQSQ
jgi:hypothetical protein